MKTAEGLLGALELTTNTAESVIKLTKVLKEGAEVYAALSNGPATNIHAVSAGPITSLEAVERNTLLEQAPLQWSKLAPEERRGLLDTVRKMSNGDEKRLLAGIFNLLRLTANFSGPAAYLGGMLGTVLHNQMQMRDELKHINGRLDSIEARLDENILAGARKAIDHLVVAANADIPQVMAQQLQLASDGFTSLKQLQREQTSHGTSGAVPNKSLITLGYWGNHLCFAMQGDIRSALIQVYQCTQELPIEGILVFLPVYFSQDYKARIDNAKWEVFMAQNNMRAAQRDNQAAQLGRAFDMAAGAVGVVGSIFVALATLHPSAILMSLQAAHKSAEHFGEASRRTAPFDLNAVANAAKHREQVLNSIKAEVIAESTDQLRRLEKFTLQDLHQIMIPVTAGWR